MFTLGIMACNYKVFPRDLITKNKVKRWEAPCAPRLAIITHYSILSTKKLGQLRQEETCAILLRVIIVTDFWIGNTFAVLPYATKHVFPWLNVPYFVIMLFCSLKKKKKTLYPSEYKMCRALCTRGIIAVICYRKSITSTLKPLSWNTSLRWISV